MQDALYRAQKYPEASVVIDFIAPTPYLFVFTFVFVQKQILLRSIKNAIKQQPIILIYSALNRNMLSCDDFGDSLWVSGRVMPWARRYRLTCASKF